ncbi:MAG TPA: hypothetical protein VKS20_12355 [Candidatus Acidoferrales bacterium]|nr:hypothetical protein [Candidatus Acidoferrales bacterium]
MNRAFGAAAGSAPARAALAAAAGISPPSKIGQRALECVPEERPDVVAAPLPVDDDAPLLLPPPNRAYDTLELLALPCVPPLAACPPPKCAPLLEACPALADACPPPPWLPPPAWLCANNLPEEKKHGAIAAKNSATTQATKIRRKEGGTGAWVMKASREARLLYGTRAGRQKLRFHIPYLCVGFWAFSGLEQATDEISAGRRKVVFENGQAARKNREKTRLELASLVCFV